MEAGLFVADALDRIGARRCSISSRTPGAHHWCRNCSVIALAADLAAEDDAVGGRHGLAGDPRFGVLAQEQIDDRVGNLVGDLVGMAFGNGFGSEQIRAAHERERVLDDIRKSLYGAP